MDAKQIKKTLKGAETGIAIGTAVALSAYIWWPVGLLAGGLWYLKRRWRKKS